MKTSTIFQKILITGCGGDIALSMAKLLRETSIVGHLIGTDVSDDHPGFAFYDKTGVLPPAFDPLYLTSLRDFVAKNDVAAIIPASEPEIRFFTNRHIDTINNVTLITASHYARQIGFDKLETARFLEKHSLPFPWTMPVLDGLPKETPCILKSTSGSGSKTVRIVDAKLVDYYRQHNTDDIWQELLLPHDQEYTCGVYRTGAKEVRTVILRRSLVGDHTGKAQTYTNSEIYELLIAIAENLDLHGSINVQLRLTPRGPVVFEINPRFSSTVSLRHRIGFCDLVWSLQEAAGIPLSPYQQPSSGIKLYRVLGDYIRNTIPVTF